MLSAVPPRSTFAVQMAGTIVGALLNCELFSSTRYVC